jgi:vacuolar-type H+-ATPase subunit I/STV1
MKKVTIAASTEIEPFIVQRIGETGKAEFQPVPTSAVEGYEGLFEHSYDYDESKIRLAELLKIVERKIPEEVKRSCELDEKILKNFAYNPKLAIEELIEPITGFENLLEAARKPYDRVRLMSASELKSQKESYESKKKALTQELLVNSAKTKLLQTLDPDELKRCLTAGLVSEDNLGDLEGYLESSGIDYKSEALNEKEVFVFVFGSEENLTRVNNLFTIYDVADVYEVFTSGELLLVLDEEARSKTLKEYSDKIDELSKKMEKVEEENQKAIDIVNKKYGSDLKKLETEYHQNVSELLETSCSVLKTAGFIIDYMNKYADYPVLRNPVISILQAWFDDADTDKIEPILKELQGKDMNLLYKIESVSNKEIKEAQRRRTK